MRFNSTRNLLENLSQNRQTTYISILCFFDEKYGESYHKQTIAMVRKTDNSYKSLLVSVFMYFIYSDPLLEAHSGHSQSKDLFCSIHSIHLLPLIYYH